MENENLDVSQDVSLDDFSADFFGQKDAAPVEATTETEDKVDTVEDDAPQLEDTQPEDDALETEDDDSTDEPEVDEQPKPKKNRFQERIDELTNARRESERREETLRIEFEALKARLEQNDTPKPTADNVVVSKNVAPTPDDKNEDGTDKYPLGEFDPRFVADQIRHELKMEAEAAAQEEQAQAERRQQEEAVTQLQVEWESKLNPARERYLDFQEKGQELIDSFSGLDQAYGEYLTTTLMSMDYGPDVLYYLANNPTEAHAIVNSGAAKATVALGRLEAKFALADEEKQTARPKVSKAPAPPPVMNKGSSVSLPSVPGDTDDLNAFETEFFKKSRRS